MIYDEAMAFLEDTKQYGSRPGLDSIRALMRELGDVQERVPVVHIGGTNGKGSVGAMLSSVLSEAGYRVGWFNTPDVFSYEEEFRMNGEPIARERLAALFTEVRAACGRVNPPHPTRFEVETAAAFLWFYTEHCDIALIEVGMGGALDATNLIKKPLVSVLTSIDRDHSQFLGDTLSEIATEKAGIIKPACPVVSVPQKPAVMDVIRKRCEAVHAPLFLAAGARQEEQDGKRESSPTESVDEVGSDPADWDSALAPLGLQGAFQRENAVCALAVLQILQENTAARCCDIPKEAIARGLANARWPGRYERLTRRPAAGPRGDGSHQTGQPDFVDPVIILDGAHNEAAARRLREALDIDFPGRSFLYIMGVLADKDCEAIARAMLRPGDLVCTVTPPDPRALSAKALAQRLQALGIKVLPCTEGKDALSCVREAASPDDVIVAFGSLSYLGILRSAWLEQSFKVDREKRIPFEVSVDPFYSEENLARLRKEIADVEAGRSILKEHDLIEDRDK